MRSLLIGSTLAAFGLMAASAAAQPFRFTFADQNGVTTSNFSTTVGASVPVRVYLTEAISGSVLSTEGLTSFGVQLTCNVAIARVESEDDIVVSPAFNDFPFTDVTGGVALMEGFAFPLAVLPDAANRIYSARSRTQGPAWAWRRS